MSDTVHANKSASKTKGGGPPKLVLIIGEKKMKLSPEELRGPAGDALVKECRGGLDECAHRAHVIVPDRINQLARLHQSRPAWRP